MEEQTLPSDVARALAARRRIVAGVCVRCGKPFEGTTKRKYCSNTCAAADYRERHRQQLNEQRRLKYQRQKNTAADK